jgi:glycosyltransferase involved in cell wall biosynthesis
MAATEIPTIGFVIEQTLGHVTHTDNLQRAIDPDPRVEARWCLVPFAVDGWAARLPGGRNWTVRSGVRARGLLRRARRTGRPDALFIHTQVPGVLIPDWIARYPSVVSIDATPQQYDALGEFYAHTPGSARAERLKWNLNRRCFDGARAVVAWSQWAKAGLIEGYGVPADKIHVLAPGVRIADWTPPADTRRPEVPVRILFVGGDLARKGGTTLLAAFRLLREELTGSGIDVELHLATGAEVAPEPGLVVHHGLKPNSAELKSLYFQSHIFCLPTRGDCLPMVLSEAGAAGLPLVSTDVAAIGEIVRDGETGFLVPPDDVHKLATRLQQLVVDPELRARLGAGARALVERDYDAVANAGRLVELLCAVAGGR